MRLAKSERTLFYTLNKENRLMKKFNYLIIAVGILILGTTCSCSNKKKSREERVEEFRSMLTANDTTQMLKLCDNAMELLKGKKIDEVVASG